MYFLNELIEKFNILDGFSLHMGDWCRLLLYAYQKWIFLIFLEDM